jgi:erythromycin esterase-like protein
MDAQHIRKMAKFAEDLARQAANAQTEPEMKQYFAAATERLVRCIESIVDELEKPK